ncbi:MAG: trypsin-like peptidase domain-containing protein [Deltaproteobacteria bacterium]|nr:trypsin-like peptidase domain-containing protein [Deltaproteobacteria bacterium]
MRTRSCLILLFGLTIGCGSSEEVFVGELTASVVYGADDRVEVFNHPDADLRRLADESILALIPSFRISKGPDETYGLFTESLKDLRGLCPDELFGNQPTAASCSGVLIADDLVLTAGHCIDDQTPCDSYAYVFNYQLAGPDELAEIRDEDVYSCARVVSQGTPAPGEFTPDYAVIQLDRPVEGAQAPVLVRPATPLGEQESLTMIGFGSGLPAKIDSGGAVADPRADQLDFFVANVDAFQGHSGSATFDSENRLAGILIGGRTPDYVPSDDETCVRVSVYDDSQAGEVVHNIASIVAGLCDDRSDMEDLCDPTACDGEPCGLARLPIGETGGAGVTAADSSGCSASTGSTGFASGLLGLLLFAVARRFRRRAA